MNIFETIKTNINKKRFIKNKEKNWRLRIYYDIISVWDEP